jgi:hypothetical protein
MRFLSLVLLILTSCTNLFHQGDVNVEIGVFTSIQKNSTYKIELKEHSLFELSHVHSQAGPECKGTYNVSGDTIYFFCQEIDGLEKYTAGSLSGYSFFGIVSKNRIIRIGDYKLKKE